MKTRVIVALSLLPIFLAILLFCPVWCTAVLTAAMSALAVYELLYTAGLLRHIRILIYSMAAAAAVSFWSCFGMPYVWGLAIFWLFLTALFCELLAANTNLALSKICVALFAGLVIPLCLSALVRILNGANGRYGVVAALILAFGSDTGAYFAGRRFGRHKLAPVISPKKTVEGLVGGILSSVLLMLLFTLILQVAFAFTVDYVAAVIYGVIGSLASVLGDLTLSVAKRQAGIKDYGRLLPGHGGILDRFDSMIVVAPMTELLLLVMPLIVK